MEDSKPQKPKPKYWFDQYDSDYNKVEHIEPKVKIATALDCEVKHLNL